MDNIFDRTIGLFGEDNYKKLENKTIAIIGLGGVGGTAFEALVRTGIKNFVICDFDKVDSTNLNRQILFTYDDIGKSKVECAIKRAKSINPEVNVIGIETKINPEGIKKLEGLKIDFLVDAIDDVKAKILLTKFAQDSDIPFLMSLGMACRMKVEDVTVTKLNRTTSDPLAKKIRYEAKEAGLDLSKINVVFSKEERMTDGVKLNSIMFTPSAAGLNIASYVVSYFIYK